MHQLIKLYLSALRSGDRPLSASLARALRSEGRLVDEAEHSLQRLPRTQVRWSAAAERTVRRILRRLA